GQALLPSRLRRSYDESEIEGRKSSAEALSETRQFGEGLAAQGADRVAGARRSGQGRGRQRKHTSREILGDCLQRLCAAESTRSSPGFHAAASRPTAKSLGWRECPIRRGWWATRSPRCRTAARFPGTESSTRKAGSACGPTKDLPRSCSASASDARASAST